MKAMTRPLRILCFGDSLTSGYTYMGHDHHPYQKALSRRLLDIFPGLELVVDVEGLDGSFTGEFPRRLARIYNSCGVGAYDWVIVLGGTNDLGMNGSPETIFENLERAWTLARLKKAKVLALTIPDLAFINASRLARRMITNDHIIGYTLPGVYSYDLHDDFTYSKMDEGDRQKYWSDAVHFWPAGYDRMGEAIANALSDILKREDASAAGPQRTTLSEVRPRRQRAQFKDDELSFDEETSSNGSIVAGPTASVEPIQRGYVVVRRKDLD